ncbi:MAG: hypothetical protein J1E01_03505 [Acetatifactor sp.]|nr:hypothetical protein [Acetatifactor sp.]
MRNKKMRNTNKRVSRMCRVTALLLSVMVAFSGCGDTTSEEKENKDDTSLEDTVEISKPTVTPLDWETLVIELGEEYTLSGDVKDYVSVSDDRYLEYILESNVDLSSPGEYEIKISGYEDSFVFPVIVRDTTCPEMELLRGYDIVTPGSTVAADALFAAVSDNDQEYVYGYYGLEKVEEAELAIPETDSPSYEYLEDSGMAREEISDSIILPEEEGLYLVNAAALDRSGNMVTAPVYFLVDGTGPQIKLRREKVTVYLDENYDFYQGVTLEDNVFSEEECTYQIDEEELADVLEHLQNGKTGTYTLTYYAADALGNTTEKVLTVTLTKRPAPQVNTDTPQGNDGNQNNQSSQETTSTASDYNLEMAQAAFAAVNEYRTSNGIAALTWNDSLYENCKVRAAEIVTSFAHTRPNGESCFTAFTVSYTTAGENIAYGYSTAQSVAEGWWNSEGHKANILNASFSQAALACYYANGRYYWVNLFIG